MPILRNGSAVLDYSGYGIIVCLSKEKRLMVNSMWKMVKQGMELSDWSAHLA